MRGLELGGALFGDLGGALFALGVVEDFLLFALTKPTETLPTLLFALNGSGYKDSFLGRVGLYR